MKRFFKQELSKSIGFALLFGAGLIAVAGIIICIAAASYNILVDAFKMFPYHTTLAIILFWLWLSYKIMPDDYED